ncbi:MAG: hypothetical protein FWF50_04485 [Defluviitaleaceae bacterium]|nr:hypothetical protein [Defluviitaleaceae bacterium]
MTNEQFKHLVKSDYRQIEEALRLLKDGKYEESEHKLNVILEDMRRTIET